MQLNNTTILKIKQLNQSGFIIFIESIFEGSLLQKPGKKKNDGAIYANPVWNGSLSKLDDWSTVTG